MFEKIIVNSFPHPKSVGWDDGLAKLISLTRISEHILKMVVDTEPKYCTDVFYSNSSDHSVEITFQQYDVNEDDEVEWDTFRTKHFTLNVKADTVHIIPCKYQYLIYILQDVFKKEEECAYVDWTLVEYAQED